MNHLSDYLTAQQVDLLMRDLHPARIMTLDGNSYLAQWDVRAMLNRVFGFGRWSDEGLDTTMLYQVETTTRAGKPAVRVGYRASRRLHIFAPDGTALGFYDGTSACEQTMPDYLTADAHDFAIKTAESGALKRAAINLGTSFGLGLYGGTPREVVRVLALDPRTGADADSDLDDAPAVEVSHDEDMVRKDGDDA